MKHVLKVMIADADEQMGKQLAKYLNEKADVEVLPIQTSGKGVLRAIKTEEPDVVLLDLVLPGMDGLRSQKFRKLPESILLRATGK